MLAPAARQRHNRTTKIQTKKSTPNWNPDKGRWSAGLAVKASVGFRLEEMEQVVSLSPLTAPTTDTAAQLRLRCLGRVLGATLVRAEPIGVLLSAPLCKLLVGRPNLITWKDLANVLPALQFGVLVACLDANLTAEEQQAKFAYVVEHGLGIDEGDGEVATFDAVRQGDGKGSISI